MKDKLDFIVSTKNSPLRQKTLQRKVYAMQNKLLPYKHIQGYKPKGGGVAEKRVWFDLMILSSFFRY